MASEATALACLETRVCGEWVDYNGHMNDAAYASVVSEGVDRLMDWLGLDAAGRERLGYTLYTLEMHIVYRAEAYQDQRITVGARLVDHDAKRLHVLMTLERPDDATTIATGEVMLMGMDTGTGRPAIFPDTINDSVATLQTQHGCREWPTEAGRAIGIRRD